MGLPISLSQRGFRFFSSLKLAVPVMTMITVSMVAATLLESYYDVKTGRYYVYDSRWFEGLMALFFLNILFSALSRWPWKPRHAPFLTAHLGILCILIGSVLTTRFGIDGSLRLQEGSTNNTVELQSDQITINDGKSWVQFPLPFVPPHVEFSPIRIPNSTFEVSQFLPHAQIKSSYSVGPSHEDREWALDLEIIGRQMGVRQRITLWAGEASQSYFDFGPFFLALLPKKQGIGTSVAQGGIDWSMVPGAEGKRGLVQIHVDPKGQMQVSSAWRRGQKKAAPGEAPVWNWSRPSRVPVQWDRFTTDDESAAMTLPVGSDVLEVRLRKAYRNAIQSLDVQPSRIQYGEQAPPGAVEIREGKTGARIWLAYGDRAFLKREGQSVEVSYSPRMTRLPFVLRLDEFRLEMYPGKRAPKSYESHVTVFEPTTTTAPSSGANSETRAVIQMNEPLKRAGFTLYQASYVPAMPRPTESILSVNRDPGRILKYGGSLLLVLGSVWLFTLRLARRKVQI